MIDIFLDKDGILRASDTNVYKAKNILSTQIGKLAYAPEFGIDYDVFFGDDLKIQNETFQSYSISRLSESGVNVNELISEETTFDATLKFLLEK